MKVVKSTCNQAWLFDVKEDDGFLLAGLACFVPGCGHEVEISLKSGMRAMMTPTKAIDSLLPIRIVNARLSLLPVSGDEQVF